MTVRPDLNGLRLQIPGNPAIWLILNGVRRHIPNPATYDNLFRNWSGIVQDINANEIDDGGPISNGARLARPANEAPVYLITNDVKMWVPSPAVMDEYHFDWNKVVSLPKVAIDSIPDGPHVEERA